VYVLKKCQRKPSWFDRPRNCTRIKYTDEKINQLVFELYGLSEEERKIVEEYEFNNRYLKRFKVKAVNNRYTF
jgi:hypothetical protein